MESQFGLDDVAGLEYQKRAIRDSIVIPRQNPELYKELVKRPEMVRERNIFLFHGPSGSGKTLLAQAAAKEIGVDFNEVQSTQFIREYRGEGAKKLRKMYSVKGEKMYFLDEIDTIAKSRSGNDTAGTYDLVMQLNMILDGPGSDADKITVFSTNRKALLDDATLSRIPEDKKLYFPKPDNTQRYKIFEKHLGYHNHDINDISRLVTYTEDYDGRQIESLFAKARNNALRMKRSYLTTNDFMK